ncbi:MAG: polysaccharide pyruvyl transferase family protein [Prosthecobacter sp.]
MGGKAVQDSGETLSAAERQKNDRTISMKFFVTGLCLQGNKGGPALALSLMKVLRAEIPEAEFVFSVPPEPEFQFEQKRARTYGVKVVEDNWDGGLPSLHPWRVLKEGLGSSLRRLRKLKTWHQSMRSCDVVLDMTAIGYVGPPEGSEYHGLGMRYRYFKAAKRTRRVFRAWTQSYGPFSTPALAKAAKEDLSTLPTVYCRGEETLRQVQAFLPGKDCRAYPDVAVVLDYDRQQGHELIKKAFGQTPDRKLVTISPSAVQFGKDLSGGESAYVRQRARLVDQLLDRGYAVLFVPHTSHPTQHTPYRCDLAVSLAIHALVRPSPWVSVIYADLSASDLKSVISCADVHIGSRYHSVVAALSAAVPAISLSWHHKYADIMTIYEQSKFVLDGQSQTLVEDCTAMVEELMARSDEVSAQLTALQPQVAAAVYENARHLVQGLPLKQ